MSQIPLPPNSYLATPEISSTPSWNQDIVCATVTQLLHNPHWVNVYHFELQFLNIPMGLPYPSDRGLKLPVEKGVNDT